MKRALLAVILGLLVCSPAVVYAEEESIETEITTKAIADGDFSTQLVEKIKIERNTIYNALNLTPKQICKKEAIEKKRYEALEPELKKLCLSRKKLKNCTNAKQTDSSAVKAAQKEVNAARKAIKNISNRYDRDFKKILTSEQRSKYNMIRKLKRAELKKVNNKSNRKPALKPFGVPVSQPEYAEQQKCNHWYNFKHKNTKPKS